MFDDQKPNNQSVKKDPEDIFADTDQATVATGPKPQVPQPQQPAQSGGMTASDAVVAPVPTPAPAQPMAPSGVPPAASSGNNKVMKTVIIVLVVLIVLVLLVIGGRYLYLQFFDGEQSAEQAAAEDQGLFEDTFVPSDINSNLNQANSNTNQAVVKSPPVADLPKDSDADGLTDAEEAELGTDPALADSDLDGLFDDQEVNQYKTDPLNVDTDGDSYQDGEEVAAGYDPNGPGRLYDVN